jgi:hypothetical protein
MADDLINSVERCEKCQKTSPTPTTNIADSTHVVRVKRILRHHCHSAASPRGECTEEGVVLIPLIVNDAER